jgi:hypothetical protein
MTKEQIIEKYGDVKVKFSSYHNFTLTFRGTAKDGTEILARIGGPSVDIRKLHVKIFEETTLRLLDPDYCELTRDGKKRNGTNS